MLAPSQCSLLLFTSLNNRARPCRLFRNPNRSLLSRSTAIRATEFLSPKSIPTKMCLTCIEASLLSKGLALFYSEPVPRLAFFYIVNSSRGGEFSLYNSKQTRIQQLINQIHQRWIDAARQSFHRRATLHMRGDVIHVLAFNARVPNFLRIQNDIRSGLAAAEAHVWLDLDATRVL